MSSAKGNSRMERAMGIIFHCLASLCPKMCLFVKCSMYNICIKNFSFVFHFNDKCKVTMSDGMTWLLIGFVMLFSHILLSNLELLQKSVLHCYCLECCVYLIMATQFKHLTFPFVLQPYNCFHLHFL